MDFKAVFNIFIKIHEIICKFDNFHYLPNDQKAISMLYSETRCSDLGLVAVEL